MNRSTEFLDKPRSALSTILLNSFFQGCVDVQAAHHRAGNKVWVHVKNTCSADIVLQRVSGSGPENITLPALSTSLIRGDAPDAASSLRFNYQATNFVVAPGKSLPVALEVVLN